MSENRPRRRAFAYVIVAVIALGAALHSSLGVTPRLSNGAAAYVNGHPIPQPEYVRALKAMQAGLERPLTDEDRTRALERLIDEELIVQEAIKLGLPSTDRLVRRNLVQGMMRSVTSLDVDAEVAEEDLKALYNGNRNLFATPRTVTLEIARSRNSEHSTRFVSLLQSGTSFPEAVLEAELTTETLPKDLPLGQVASRLGGSAGDMIARMQEGDIAGPAVSADGEIFLWMTGSKGGVAAFEDVREAVKAELLRRQDEAALDDYLLRLRKRARIKKAPIQK